MLERCTDSGREHEWFHEALREFNSFHGGAPAVAPIEPTEDGAMVVMVTQSE